MARIQEEIVVIRLSKLVKKDATNLAITGKEFDQNLEDVIQELVGDGVVVEIERNTE